MNCLHIFNIVLNMNWSAKPKLWKDMEHRNFSSLMYWLGFQIWHINTHKHANWVQLLLNIYRLWIFSHTHKKKNLFRIIEAENVIQIAFFYLCLSLPLLFNCLNIEFAWNCINLWTWITTIISIEFIHSIFMIDMKYWFISSTLFH